MADGSRKPIRKVKLGDKVMAADPVTGVEGPRTVVDLIRHSGAHVMVAVQLADGSVLNATDHHRFWVANRQAWVDAIDLKAGDQVVDRDGNLVVVSGVGISEQDLTAYNLTISGLHTYFVGKANVLVHNDGANLAACKIGASPSSRISAPIWSSTKSSSAAENALSHFNDHRADFPHLNNSLEYVAEAQAFMRNPSSSTLTITRTNGDTVQYDPQSDLFGVMDSTGAPKTYFKPDPAQHGYPTNMDYFNAQNW